MIEELRKTALAAMEEEKAKIKIIIQLEKENKELVEKILVLEAQIGFLAVP